MIKKNIIWTTLILWLLSSCQNKQDDALALREKELLKKEQEFALKEADYQSLVKMRDSISSIKKDTASVIKAWPEAIAGSWNGKVICTESNCSDYVIGDQRTDNWVFVSDSTQMAVKILNNNKIVRIYTSEYTNDEIRMKFRTDSTSSKKVEMNILLDDITPTKMRGTRTVISDKNCIAKFSVELVRPSNK
ncbi:hypothetical protein [Epilithonimonas mollis]|uniref:Uncharacterized protein n=1 Tax=Epilithonimonas mollis TaxID=216903 RepID=A0A1M6TZF7_9FLAO|nr:hypothetical protein [Epilithonimonas mollis]SHK62301.1 hypothetical protein SAMN05444371_3032 [Epilithonimonas mollis]